jgi:signal transduction histidine kinase
MMMLWFWWRAALSTAMNRRASEISREYVGMLRAHLHAAEEGVLHKAYELGRKAALRGVGIFDIARIHQQALAICLLPLSSAEERTKALNAAEAFFLEVLSPFEAAHRGFREAYAALRRRNAELASLSRSLRDLSTQVLHVQEEERKHISRELHDEVGQALTAISMNLPILERDYGVDKVHFQKVIADTEQLLRQTMETVHGFARELRPAMLDELGLLPTLRSYLNRFAERTGIQATFSGSQQAEKLNNHEKTVLFRVVQESLTNVAKHAHASCVSVILQSSNDLIKMEIRDDGKSFRATPQHGNNSNGKKRLGLLGMRERVRLVNGYFAMVCTPGEGTTVVVEIPFKAVSPRSVERSAVSARGGKS